MNTIRMPSGDYAVLSQLRKTGSKVLYLARNEHTGQQVVLCKLLKHIDVYSLLQLVTHENLVRVLDVETQSSGITYVIMEYIDAPLLSDAMSQRPFAQREVIRIGIQLCAALHALHSVGLIHRDVKPENVFLLSDGTVKLFDYDASRIFKAAIGSDTTPMGTFGYAAPEQFGLKQSDARSDIYALGILLNMLAVGEHPSIRLCKGTLQRIVLRCTHVSPEKRYRNASQVQHALQNCLLQRWTAPAAITAMLAVFILLALPFKRSPDLSVPSSPSPAFPAPTMTTNPIHSSVLTPTPSPTQYQTLSNFPPVFEDGMSSVREITLDGNTYYILLSTEDAEQFSPRLDATERQVYFSEGDEMILYLYVWPSDGDLDNRAIVGANKAT